MSRFRNVNGTRYQFTAAEECEYDTSEAAVLAAVPSIAFADLRAERNNLLRVSDWTV